MVAPSRSSPLVVAPTATQTTRASMTSVQKQQQEEGDADNTLNHSDSSFTVNVQEDTDKKSTQIHKSVSFVSGKNDDLAREYRVIPYWTIQDDDKLWYSADEITRMRGEHTTSLERLEESLRQQEADDDDDDEEPNYYESHSHAVAFQELYRANQHNSLPIDKALRAKIVNLYLESDEWVGLERVAAGLPSQQPNKIREILQACQKADQSDTNEENDATMPLQRKCQILSRGDRSFAANSGMAIAASIMMESVGERLAKAASMSMQNKKSPHKSKTPSPTPENRIITSDQQEEADYISDIDDNDMDDVFDESDSENDDDDDDNNSIHSGKSLGSTKSVLSSKSLSSTSSKYSMKDAIDNLLEQKQKEQALNTTRRASLTDAAPSRRGRFKLSKDRNTNNMPPSEEDNMDRPHKTNMPRRASMESSGRAMMLMKASQQGKARLDKDALKEMMMESKKERTPAPRKILVSFAETLVTQNHLTSACQDEENDAVIWYTKAELKALARDFLHAPQTLEKAGAIGKGTASTLSRVFDLSEEEKALPEKLQSRLLGYYVEFTDIVGLEYIIMGQRYVQARRLKEIMEAIHRIQDSVNGPLQHRAIVAASRKITKQARDFAVRMGMGQAAAATVVNALGGAEVPKRGLRRSKGSSKSLGSSRSLKSIKSHKSSKGSRPLERSSSSKKLERSSSSKKLERSSSKRLEGKESSKKKLERSESKRLERKTSSKKRLGRSSSREKVRSHSSSSHKSRKSRSKSHDDKEGSKKRSSSVKSRKLEKAGSKKKLVKSSSKKNLEKDSKKEVDDHSEHQPRRKLTKRNQESL